MNEQIWEINLFFLTNKYTMNRPMARKSHPKFFPYLYYSLGEKQCNKIAYDSLHISASAKRMYDSPSKFVISLDVTRQQKEFTHPILDCVHWVFDFVNETSSGHSFPYFHKKDSVVQLKIYMYSLDGWMILIVKSWWGITITYELQGFICFVT